MEAYLLLSIGKQRIFGPLFPSTGLALLQPNVMIFCSYWIPPSYREMNKAKFKAVASSFSKPPFLMVASDHLAATFESNDRSTSSLTISPESVAQ
jgi:hypothetical protein